MNPIREEGVLECYLDGRFGATDLSEMFGVSRSTVHRLPRPAQS